MLDRMIEGSGKSPDMAGCPLWRFTGAAIHNDDKSSTTVDDVKECILETVGLERLRATTLVVEVVVR